MLRRFLAVSQSQHKMVVAIDLTHADDATTTTTTTTSTTQPSKEHIFKSMMPLNPIPNTGITLHQYVLFDIEKHVNRIALVDTSDGRQYTYGEVQRLSKNVAAGLANQFNIKKGDVVFILLPNVAEYFIFVLGIISIGAVFSGSNPSAHLSEIAKQVEDSEAKLIITSSKAYEKVANLGLPVVILGDHEGLQSSSSSSSPGTTHSYLTLFKADGSLAPEVQISPHDVCALPYSSGTTGVSKGVMLTHRNLVTNLCQTLADIESALASGAIPEGESVTLGLMPFFHIYGISGICCASMRLKGKVLVMARYNFDEFLDSLLRYGVTHAPLVPPILLQLVKNDLGAHFDWTKLKLKTVLTAAAPLGTELQKAFESKFSGVEVQQAYGLTEYSCITITHCNPSHGRRPAKPGSVGFIVSGIELKFLDQHTGLSLPVNVPGELCVRGESCMKGYFKNPVATAATVDSEGWLHTGDVGYIDEDGDVFIVERIKELIKYKGFQVPPAELEAILISHPAIADAAVVPIPDEEAGEIPAACVVLKQDTFISSKEIQEFVASKVASYKQVRHVQFFPSIPKSSSGKILRRVLKDQVMMKQASPDSIDH